MLKKFLLDTDAKETILFSIIGRNLIPLFNFIGLMLGTPLFCKEFNIQYSPLVFFGTLIISAPYILLPIGSGYYFAQKEISIALTSEFTGKDEIIASARINSCILKWWYSVRKRFFI